MVWIPLSRLTIIYSETILQGTGSHHKGKTAFGLLLDSFYDVNVYIGKSKSLFVPIQKVCVNIYIYIIVEKSPNSSHMIRDIINHLCPVCIICYLTWYDTTNGIGDSSNLMYVTWTKLSQGQLKKL